jgi:hypothetical protein
MNRPGKEIIGTISFKSVKSGVAEHEPRSKVTLQKISLSVCNRGENRKDMKNWPIK